MNTASSTTHSEGRALSRLQVAGISWLVGSVPVAVASWLLLAISESSAGVLGGGVLAVLTLGAWATAAWLLTRPRAAGVPALVALATAAVVLAPRRS